MEVIKIDDRSVDVEIKRNSLLLKYFMNQRGTEMGPTIGFVGACQNK